MFVGFHVRGVFHVRVIACSGDCVFGGLHVRGVREGFVVSGCACSTDFRPFFFHVFHSCFIVFLHFVIFPFFPCFIFVPVFHCFMFFIFFVFQIFFITYLILIMFSCVLVEPTKNTEIWIAKHLSHINTAQFKNSRSRFKLEFVNYKISRVSFEDRAYPPLPPPPGRDL